MKPFNRSQSGAVNKRLAIETKSATVIQCGSTIFKIQTEVIL